MGRKKKKEVVPRCCICGVKATRGTIVSLLCDNSVCYTTYLGNAQVAVAEDKKKENGGKQ